MISCQNKLIGYSLNNGGVGQKNKSLLLDCFSKICRLDCHQSTHKNVFYYAFTTILSTNHKRFLQESGGRLRSLKSKLASDSGSPNSLR